MPRHRLVSVCCPFKDILQSVHHIDVASACGNAVTIESDGTPFGVPEGCCRVVKRKGGHGNMPTFAELVCH